MHKNVPIEEYQYDDYAQSANALFHFMRENKYLNSILLKKAIVPRYCMESIEYLNIQRENTKFKEIAILQKCFCDIPFHKLTDNFELNGSGASYDSLTDKEKLSLMNSNTHPDFYGKFAIAFSKRWGEKNNLQPVHYLNENSVYTLEFSKLLVSALQSDDMPEEYGNYILDRLSFIKPLRGIMERSIRRDNAPNKSVGLYKNFHDEQEWRYIPSADVLSPLKLERIIANPNILALQEGILDINNSIETDRYKQLWLKYDYNDIRYIIVPDSHSRIDLINTIMSIADEQLDEQIDTGSPTIIQKYILISKILVLDEIRKDW